MTLKRMALLLIVLNNAIICYSWDKNSPDDPFVIDNEADITENLKGSPRPALLNNPLIKEERYWDHSSSSFEVYRLLKISYMGLVVNGQSNYISAVKIVPGDVRFPRKYTQDDCGYFSIASLKTYTDNYSWNFSDAKNLWIDIKQAVVGFQSPKDVVSFVRLVCLPAEVVDDLDMIGIEYAYAANPKTHKEDVEQLKAGKALYVAQDDPRLNFRYDPKRFFERFEAYGLTPRLKVPNTQPREAWDSNAWNTTIKVFPLGGALTLPQPPKTQK